MENENEMDVLDENQLGAVTGGEEDKIEWQITGYCTQCKGHRVIPCIVYPGTGPFYCSCGTELVDVKIIIH